MNIQPSPTRSKQQTIAQAISASRDINALREKMAAKYAGQPIKPPYSGPCREDCPICNGLGWVRQDVPTWHPAFGMMTPCPNSKAALQKSTSHCGLPFDVLQSAAWKDVLNDINPATGHAARAAQAIIARGYGLAVFTGGYGVGKSLILQIAVAEAVRQGKTAQYTNASDMLDYLRRAYDHDEHDGADVLQRIEMLSAVPLLAIDELGKTSATGWAREKLFQVLDRRHVSSVRQEAVTLVSLNDNEMGAVDPALLDRFHDKRHGVNVFHVDGESARPIMPVNVRY